MSYFHRCLVRKSIYEVKKSYDHQTGFQFLDVFLGFYLYFCAFHLVFPFFLNVTSLPNGLTGMCFNSASPSPLLSFCPPHCLAVAAQESWFLPSWLFFLFVSFTSIFNSVTDASLTRCFNFWNFVCLCLSIDIQTEAFLKGTENFQVGWCVSTVLGEG